MNNLNIIVTQALQSLSAQVVQLSASVKSLEQRLNNNEFITQRDLDMAIAKASLSAIPSIIPSPTINTFSPTDTFTPIEANSETTMSFLENPQEDDIVINTTSQPKKKSVRRKNT